jgi:hypothetical protein
MRDLHYATRIQQIIDKPSSATRMANALAAVRCRRKRLPPAPTVEIVHTGEIDAQGAVRLSDGTKARVPASTVAYFLPSKNKLVFFIDNIPAGQELSVILHELFHNRGRQLLGDEKMKRLRDEVNSWRNAPEGSIERKIYNAAMPKVIAATEGLTGKEKQDLHDEELLPYFITEAARLGVRPDQKAALAPGAKGWMSRVWTMFRNAIHQATGRSIPAGLSRDNLMAAAWAQRSWKLAPSATS